MSVNESLAHNCYHPADHPHIVLCDTLSNEQFTLLEKVCPAGLFQRTARGLAVINYRGCLECGCCRLMIGDAAVLQWSYPASGTGIFLRYS